MWHAHTRGLRLAWAVVAAVALVIGMLAWPGIRAAAGEKTGAEMAEVAAADASSTADTPVAADEAGPASQPDQPDQADQLDQPDQPGEVIVVDADGASEDDSAETIAAVSEDTAPEQEGTDQAAPAARVGQDEAEPPASEAVDQPAQPATAPRIDLSASGEGPWLCVAANDAPVGATLRVTMRPTAGIAQADLAQTLPDASFELLWQDGLPVARVSFPMPAGQTELCGVCALSVDFAELLDQSGATVAQASLESSAGATFASTMRATAGETVTTYWDDSTAVYYDNYLTYRFYVDGAGGSYMATCMNPDRPAPANGSYPIVDPLEYMYYEAAEWQWNDLRMCMWFGPTGPGYEWAKANLWPQTWYDGTPITDDELYAIQHVLISDLFTGNAQASLYGCSDEFVSWCQWNVTGFDYSGNIVNESSVGRRIRAVNEEGRADPIADTVPDDFVCAIIGTGDAQQALIYCEPYTPAPKLGALEFSKTNASSSITAQATLTLAGATYELRNQDGSTVAVLVCDADGKAWVDQIPQGDYTLVETAAPAGWALDATPIPVHVTADQTTQVSAADQPQSDPLVLVVRKTDAQTGQAAPQGDGSLAGAQFEVAWFAGQFDRASLPAEADRTWVVATDGAGQALLDDAHKLGGDDFFYDSAGRVVVPVGTVCVRETAAPAGYVKSEDVWVVSIAADGSGQESVEVDLCADVPETVVRGGLSVRKVDAQTGGPSAQGDATLAGAQFEVVNASAAGVVVDGEVFAPGEVVTVIETDGAGLAATAADLLPFGTYTIREARAPQGYLPGDSGWSATVEIREPGVVVAAGEPCEDQVVRGGLSVRKVDAQTGGPSAQGDATLAGAQFEVVNASAAGVVVDGEVFAPGEVVAVIETDGEGLAATAADLLPFGTYTIREARAPQGYLSGDPGWSATVEIREPGVVVAAGEPCEDQVVRGDVRLTKVDEATMARMGGVAFLVTSKTTGESHVVMADENGELNTAASWNSHTLRTNASDAALAQDGQVDEARLDPYAGVWFYGSADATDTPAPDDALGALPYDTYGFKELATSASAGHELVEFEVTVTRHATTIDLGTVADKPGPRIFTRLTGDGGAKQIQAAGEVVLTDEVGYEYLRPGATYKLELSLVYPDGTPLVDSAGAAITASKEFTPVAASGSEQICVTVDASQLSSMSVVAFERLLDKDGTPVAEHADAADAEQTVAFVQIGTTLLGAQTQGHIARAEEDCQLVDTVSYKGLACDGRAYQLRGYLLDQQTGERLCDAAGQLVSASQTFVPEQPEGSVEVIFTFDASGLAGRSVVAEEHVFEEGRELAVHADLTDEDQTVTFPHLTTTLVDADGTHVGDPLVTVQLTDNVTFSGLVPGLTYQLTGSLMDAETGEPLTCPDGTAVISTVVFEAAEAAGEQQVPFTLDAQELGLAGRGVVAFETLSLLLVDGTEDVPVTVAEHADLSDAEQTVAFGKPWIATTFLSAAGTHETAAADEVELTDNVAFDGLEPGQSYQLTGTLIDRASGEPLTGENGQPVSSTVDLTPQESAGSTQVPFTLDASELGGRDIVAFEALSRDGEPIIAHEDPQASDQTVSVVGIRTTASDRDDGDRQVVPSAYARLEDAVELTGLEPGATYTIATELVDALTHDPVPAGTCSAQITPTAENVVVRVRMTVDVSSYAGRDLVFLETLTRDGVTVAQHCDYGDEDQTLAVSPAISTMLTDAADGDHEALVDQDKGEVELVDAVDCRGLEPGETYELTGTLMLADGSPLEDADGREVTATTTFVADKADGTAEVTFSFDAGSLADQTKLVAFERLTLQGEVIARHEDLADEGQTVTVRLQAPNQPSTPSTPAPSSPSTPTPTSIGVPKTGDATVSPALLAALGGMGVTALAAGLVVLRLRRKG